ncbi:MAG: ACT domain-containing protein, partial [Candidatus Methanomethyliaceae archaeon]
MKQISVFLENRPGRLANLLKILKDNEINILAMGIAEAGNYGIVRLILDQPDKAIEILRNMNMA